MPEELVRLRCCSTCRASYRSDFARCPVDGGVIAAVDEDPLIGVTVGHYTIDCLLGEGGMGRVYGAHHTLLAHRRVALKVLLGDLAATMSTRLRFSKEAEAASQLDHPNVVSVTDFGRTDAGLLYLAMELVEGRPLSSVIAEGPMPPRRVIALARQMTAGLGHAHERGFVHRDFKPDNVLVVDSPAGEVARIVDFGLAISADPTNESPRFTTVGIVVGTPVYAAPEQTHGRPIDHRADLFALGVTLFEMLAGTVPYEGSLGQIVLRNAAGDLPSIRDRAPGVEVPPALEALVRRLMSPAEADRPQSTREVLDALDALDTRDTPDPHDAPDLTVAPVPALPSSGAPGPARGSRRPRWALPAIGALVGIVGLGAVLASHPRDDERPTVASAATQPPVRASAASSTSATSSLPSSSAEVSPVDDADAAERPRDPATDVAERVSATSPAETPGDSRVRPERATSPRRRERRGPSPSPPAGSTSEPAREEVAIAPATPALVPPVDEPEAGLETTTPPPSLAPSPAAGPGSASPAPAPSPEAGRAAAPARSPAQRPAPNVTSIAAAFEAVQVRGSLSAATVRRALDRVLPALRACHGPDVSLTTDQPVVLGVQLVIDEHQRATSVRVASAAHPRLSACVAAALESIRSDAAPDVGIVTVRAALRFKPGAP